MRNRPLLSLCLGALLALGTACPKSAAERAEEQLEALKKQQAAEKTAKKDGKPAPLPVDVVKLDPPYDDEGTVRLQADGPCPEGLWALFPGPAPGATREEQKANEARRGELVKELKGKRFLVKLRAPEGVKLSSYDAPRGRFLVDVLGSVDCADQGGHLTVAWTEAKAVDPGKSAAKADAEVSQNVWEAAPIEFELPITSQAEAKGFEEHNRFGLSARVAFTIEGGRVDKKLRKVAKVSTEAAGEKLSIGGGVEDWGAGRLVRARLVGVRVATEQEKKQLFEKR